MANPPKRPDLEVLMNGYNPRDRFTCQVMRLDLSLDYLFHVLCKVTLFGLCFDLPLYSTSHHVREMVPKTWLCIRILKIHIPRWYHRVIK